MLDAAAGIGPAGHLMRATRRNAMAHPIELFAALAPGQTKTPEIMNPNGTSSPFVVPPKKKVFVATDISANRLSVVSSPVLVAFNLQQNLGPGGIVGRWQFVGEVTQNVERAFTTGIVFSKPMLEFNLLLLEFNLLSSSGDSFSIRVNGYFA
jgi:hypothetical protein